MSEVIQDLYIKLENKENELKTLKKSYNKTIDFYKNYGKDIESKNINEQSIDLNNISQKISKIEIEIFLMKYVINSLKEEKEI